MFVRLSVCPSICLSVNKLVSTFSLMYILSPTYPNKFIFGLGILYVFPDIKLIFVLRLSIEVKVKGHFEITWLIKHMKIALFRNISRMIWTNNFKLCKCTPMEMTVICDLLLWPWPLTLIKHIKIALPCNISRTVWANNFRWGTCTPMEVTMICDVNLWPWPLTLIKHEIPLLISKKQFGQTISDVVHVYLWRWQWSVTFNCSTSISTVQPWLNIKIGLLISQERFWQTSNLVHVYLWRWQWSEH